MMLQFSFTEEQEDFRKILRQYSKEVLLPQYTKWDREKRRRDIYGRS